ncbi:LysR substrate-binding domain-containing protein [Sodalis sp. RH13]
MLTRCPNGSWRSISGRQRFVSDRGEALLVAALSGMGIAYLPAFLFEQHLEAKRLIQVLPECRTEEVPISVMYPSKRYLPAKVRAFVDALVEAAKDTAPVPPRY